MSHEQPDRLVLSARDVHFDWSRTPLHWVPGEPFATHIINVMHLLLPEGERWFVKVFQQALPLIRDAELREQVIGFVGQEAVHAESHQGAQEHLRAQGIDPDPYVRQVEWMFARILGDRDLDARGQRAWLVERLAYVAAVEHVTAFLGQWILDARGLDRAGADPTMLDLLRWHGAEEVEHRSVAFDLYTHVDSSYLRRLRAMVIVGPVLVLLWVRGLKHLLRADPELGGRVRPRWRDVSRGARKGLLPSYGQLLRKMATFFRRSYHPSQEGSTAQAVAYLATSPAARAAEH
ncbi:metal-dependent hydrolase [Crossiella sp. SN42]|uniref:metal-dependent hydrolase n=1 Tax=Crossiella sp. SN42 TaxID=2944808 RepID=UPI00207D15A2|nr:metal-dependent hydrolase [Crossiella sp. SN42]MCO1578432.1 metal-dependent hydrolase [Crossiella sp. SN42]